MITFCSDLFYSMTPDNRLPRKRLRVSRKTLALAVLAVLAVLAHRYLVQTCITLALTAMPTSFLRFSRVFPRSLAVLSARLLSSLASSNAQTRSFNDRHLLQDWLADFDITMINKAMNVSL